MEDDVCEDCRHELSVRNTYAENKKNFAQTAVGTEGKNRKPILKRVLRTSKILLAIYLAAIVIKVLVLFFDGKIVRYSALDLSVDSSYGEASWDGKTPKLLPLNPTSYKFNGSQIISKTAGGIRFMEPPECQIWDLKNWTCTWPPDGIFTKGHYVEKMEDGAYFAVLSDWSYDEVLVENRHNDLGEFAYNIIGCRWDFYEFLNGLIICPLRFAFL